MAIPHSGPAEAPIYKEQTRFKHDVLSNYMTRWGLILGGSPYGRKRRLHYVDCFAASGIYSEDNPGSPIIAMEIGQKLHERYENCYLEYHFVERDRRRYEELRVQVEFAKYDFPAVWARPYQGRFERKLDQIFEGIDDKEPALVFLDPYRIMEIETVIRLPTWRKEVSGNAPPATSTRS